MYLINKGIRSLVLAYDFLIKQQNIYRNRLSLYNNIYYWHIMI